MALIPPVRQDSLQGAPNGRGTSPRVRMRTAIVREASPADYPQIVELHKRNGLQTKSEAEWNSVSTQNPVYRRSKNFPIGWVLETSDGQIVGSITNIPVAYDLGGRHLLAASACAWATDPPYRRYSMLLLDQVMKQTGVDFFICTTVSPQSETSLRFFRWVKVPVGRWDQSKFWITAYRPFVKRALKLRSIPAAGALAYPASLALLCYDRWRGALSEPDDAGLEIREQSDFDARFDTFWQVLKQEKSGTLMAVRDRESLTWHFGPSLSAKKACLVTVSSGARLVAYAVFQRQDVIRHGFTRMRLADYQGLRAAGHALERALNLMVLRCVEQRIDLVETIGYVPNDLSIRGRRAYNRQLDAWRFYYKANSPEMAGILSDTTVWAPTCFDGDASL